MLPPPHTHLRTSVCLSACLPVYLFIFMCIHREIFNYIYGDQDCHGKTRVASFWCISTGNSQCYKFHKNGRHASFRFTQSMPFQQYNIYIQMQAPAQQQQLLLLPQLPPLPGLLHPVPRVNATICHDALRSAQIVDILLTAFSNALCRIKIFELPLEWHWTLILRGQDWLRWRLRIQQPVIHFLNHWWFG